jgi:hypothetical protein
MTDVWGGGGEGVVVLVAVAINVLKLGKLAPNRN